MNYTMTKHNEFISVNSPEMLDMTSLNSIGILEYTNKEQYFNEYLLIMTKCKDIKLKILFKHEEDIVKMFNEKHKYFKANILMPSTSNRISLFYHDNINWIYSKKKDSFILQFEDANDNFEISKSDWKIFMKNISLTYINSEMLHGKTMMIDNFLKWCDNSHIEYTMENIF
ncbi:MAG: hypothetical protein HP023_09835 [Lachnospiraceae bacterium]|nr:hypothetical protein [Lachnospiraceae bacterium]